MKKLKIQDLQVGKIYKFTCDGDLEDFSESIYKIDEEGDLYYKDSCLKDSFLESNLFYNEVINGCFVEIKREIDWNKVPRGTKVQVRNNTNQKWENAYLVSYSDNVFPLSFESSPIKDDEFTKFKAERISDLFSCCRIHESVAIPDEWYKEVK